MRLVAQTDETIACRGAVQPFDAIRTRGNQFSAPEVREALESVGFADVTLRSKAHFSRG